MMQPAPLEAAAIRAVPLPDTHWSLFLDVDGTLLDLAATPGAVVVDAALLALLERLRRAARGALALVSGRTIVDLDRLFSPLRLPAAGIHGCERRDAQGTTRVADVVRAQLDAMRHGLAAIADRHPGLLLEDKGAALALHFLRAPHMENELRAQVALLAAPLVPEFALLDGHAVIEIKPAMHTKDSAVSAFLEEAPFAGRMPIFIGDDHTDYGGFEAVRRAGGMAIAVGPRVTSDWHLSGPKAVRAWLEQLAAKAQLAVPA
jgi:trehalose 6-phosphate phosphatase